MAADLKVLTNEIKHLATREDVTSSIAIHAEKCLGARVKRKSDSLIPRPRLDYSPVMKGVERVLIAIAGAIAAGTAVWFAS